MAEISIENDIKRVSSFSEIDISRIEFVSIFYKNGHVFHAVGDQINGSLSHLINDPFFLYGFVNIVGGGFIIVDINI